MTCPPRTGPVCEGAPLGQADGQRETGPLACRVGTQAGASAIPKAEPGPCGDELVVVAKGAKIAGPQCPRQRESSRPFTSARLRLQAPRPPHQHSCPCGHPWKAPRGLRVFQEGSHPYPRVPAWTRLQTPSERSRIELPRGIQLCLLPGPRRRSRVWVRQATQNQQTLKRNPAKGEQGSESPTSGPAKP
jgi:hypothetical protein